MKRVGSLVPSVRCMRPPAPSVARVGPLVRLVMVALLVTSLPWAAGCQARERPPLSPFPPKRIVSLAPSVTELIYDLGCGDRIVGVTRFCRYPPEALSKTVVGTLVAIDLETMVSLGPDLVIGTRALGFGERSRGIDALGIPSVFLPADTVEDVLLSVRRLGELLGCGTAAEDLAVRFRGDIDRWRERTGSLRRPRVAFVVDHPPFVAVRGSFAHEMIEIAGGRNVFGDLTGPAGYRQVGAEEILARDPEVILDASVRQSEAGAPARVRAGRIVAYWRAVPGLGARVVPFEAIRPSLRIGRWIGAMARILHPGESWPLEGQ